MGLKWHVLVFQTYTIQGTPKDGGILPRALDVVFNSIEGKHYSKLNLKPRFCTDVIRLTDEEEHRENAFKNALLSSLDKDVSIEFVQSPFQYAWARIDPSFNFLSFFFFFFGSMHVSYILFVNMIIQCSPVNYSVNQFLSFNEGLLY